MLTEKAHTLWLAFVPGLFLLSLLFFAPFASAAASPPLVLHATTASAPLAGHLDILEDETGRLTIKEVSAPGSAALFKPDPRPVPHFGYTSHVYWVRFTIDNEAATEKRWLLELNFPLANYLDFYAPTEGGGFERMQAGAMRPMSIRKFQHRNPVFPVFINGPGKTFYLRIDARGRSLMPLTLWTPEAFAQMDSRRNLVHGCYFGAMMVMFVYNLFVFLSLRDRNYLFYILDICCFALFVFFSNGFLIEFVSGDTPSINTYAPLNTALALLAGLLFSRNFLDTARNAPFMDRIFKILLWVAVLFIPAFFVVSPDVWKRVIGTAAGIASIFGLTAGVVCFRRGYHPARYYVAARSFRMLGIGCFVFAANNLLPTSLLTNFGLQIGSILEVMLTSFALADRITIMRREKEAEMLERNRLEHAIVHISEDERRRISHDLHDGLCQQLTAARLRFSVLKRKQPASAEVQPELTTIATLLDDAVNHAYSLSRGLWPVELDPIAAIPSLQELARRLAESSGIPIEFSRKQRCENCTSRHVIQLHRIAQEAITNALKHAQAGMIQVGFDCCGNGIVLEVRDNGIGRSAEAQSPGGLGTGIMHHRARIIDGDLQILDGEGGGTAVVCRVACDAIKEQHHGE